jgi:hypothetical protein
LVIHCIDATSQKHSEGQAHKEGTINEASILRSRIRASHKGKQIQEGSCIHGEQRQLSFSDLRHPSTAASKEKAPATEQGDSSSHHKGHQLRPVTREEGSHRQKEDEIGGKVFQSPTYRGSV